MYQAGRKPPTGIAEKIDPASLAFDVDGVIADTMGLFLEIARTSYHVKGVRYEDITCYSLEECLTTIDATVIDAIVGKIVSGAYDIPLKAIKGAKGTLSRIAAAHRPILLVTARPHPGPVPDWLSHVLSLGSGAVDLVATGTSRAKAGVLKQHRIRFFVDDRLDTCHSLYLEGIVPILFKQPWNREPHPFMEVETWADLESLIDLPQRS